WKISEALLEIGVNIGLVRQVVRNGAVDLLEREDGKAINNTLWGRAIQEGIDHGIQGHACARDAIGPINLCDVGCGHRCAPACSWDSVIFILLSPQGILP